MMGLRLRLDGTAGTSIEEAAEKMMELCEKLEVAIDLRFNNVDLIAYRGGSAVLLAQAYRRVLLEPGELKSAYADGGFSVSKKTEGAA